MPERRKLNYDDKFFDALIQLPEWPASKDAVEKMVSELARQANPGELIPDSLVYIARKTAILPNEKTIRLVVYFSRDDVEYSLTILWVDDEDRPSKLPDPKIHRLPPSDLSN